jgi:serine/threonine protein kinase
MFDMDIGLDSRMDDNLAQTMEMYAFEKDRYLCLEDLGCGATAEVQKARDKRKANYVAIKRFRSKNKKYGFYEAKIMCEMKKLDSNENMFLTKCKKMAWDREGGDVHLILIIDIGVCSLSDLIYKRYEESQRYSENEIILILQDILKGLSVLEKLKIVHGDIKPDNILYCRNPSRYVITDFGVSQFVYQDWRTTTIVSRGHTPKYLAPLEHGNTNPFKQDIWAVGVSCLDLIEFNENFTLSDMMIDLQDIGLSDELIAKYIKKSKYTPMFLDLLKAMLTRGSEQRKDAETLLQEVISTIQKKKEILKEAIGENKPQKKNMYAFQIQEENYAKRVEESKVVNMSTEFEKIQFIEGFIQEYDKLYDFNYCMRLTEKKLEILESNKPEYSKNPELFDERRGGDEARVRALLSLGKRNCALAY